MNIFIVFLNIFKILIFFKLMGIFMVFEGLICYVCVMFFIFDFVLRGFLLGSYFGFFIVFFIKLKFDLIFIDFI